MKVGLQHPAPIEPNFLKKQIKKLLDKRHYSVNLISQLRDRIMSDRFEFQIPDVNLEKFKALMKKVSNKSVKLGFEPIPVVVVGSHVDKKKGKVWDMYLSTPSFKIAGWQFVATLDHTPETGNILRCLPDQSVPEKFRAAAPICEHCGINRYRRDTYVLRSDDGEFKQVGKTCLVDFLGHDPKKLAQFAEYICTMADDIRGYGNAEVVMLELSRYLQLSALGIRLNGWVSRKNADELKHATADIAGSMYWDRKHNWDAQITESDKKDAQEALDWAQSLTDKTEKSDYEYNVSIVANSEWIEPRSSGIAASIVGVYLKNRDQAAINKIAAEKSDYVGTVGERITHKVKVVTTRTLDNSIMVKMVDEAGNMFTWFSTSGNFPEKDKLVEMTGRVKDHSEYKGVKSTLMNRCKFEEVK